MVAKPEDASLREEKPKPRKSPSRPDLSHLYEHIGDIEAPLDVEWKAKGAAGAESRPAPGRVVRTIPAGEFKAKCLALLDEVGERDEEILVTKRGRAVARLIPVEPERGPGRPSLSHYVRFTGDVESPIDIEWDAMK